MPTRAEVIATNLAQPRSVTAGRYVFSLPAGVWRVGENAIAFKLAVTKDGVPIKNPHLDTPIIVANPPARIPDGTTTQITRDGVVFQRKNYTSDHAGMLRAWLQHIVRELRV